MAVGEAACVSVHGANRLGSNSLLDLVVFGRAAAIQAAKVVTPGAAHKRLPADAGHSSIARLDKARNAKGGHPHRAPALKMQKDMQDHCAVFRTATFERGPEENERCLGRHGRFAGDGPLDDLELGPC